jgi:ketosteroid isomerase-like protein
MTRNQAAAFAAEWAAAWNGGAVERVLAHFADNVVFRSPTALAVVGVGTVSGKDALRAYWSAALGRLKALRFTVDRVLWDPATQELAIIYMSEIDGNAKRVSENLRFGPAGLVVSAEVFHGVAGDPSPSVASEPR